MNLDIHGSIRDIGSHGRVVMWCTCTYGDLNVCTIIVGVSRERSPPWSFTESLPRKKDGLEVVEGSMGFICMKNFVLVSTDMFH